MASTVQELLKPVPVWHGTTERQFRDEIADAYRPAVLRGLVRDWPVVQAACRSPEDACRYLVALDNGAPVDAILMPPQARGRIQYDDAMDGFNFVRNRLSVSAVVEHLSRYAMFEHPPSVAVQSAPIADCMPGFTAAHRLAILDAAVAPRLWLGNRITVPAHFDESDNVACVVAGRRRFMLFPPEQVGNLYIGPLDFAPTGAAMSLANCAEPDFTRFPKLRQALAAAFVAELGPGDAIFIPTLWWHHVESLDPTLNVLVNYWWNGALGDVQRSASAMDCLMHSVLNIRPLPDELRRAWAALFHHYVFDASDDSLAHIPEGRRGVLGGASPAAAQRIRSMLIAKLKRGAADES